MASTINATPTSSGLIQTADNSGVLALQTGGTTAVTIDGSQNVGIGTASPAKKLDVVGTMGITDTITSTKGNQVFYSNPSTGTNANYMQLSNTGGAFYLGNEDSAGSIISGTAYSKFLWGTGAYPMVFATNANERMRIDSTGNIYIANTNSQIGGDTARMTFSGAHNSGYFAIAIISTTSTGNQNFINFARGGSQCGYIYSGSTNSTSYLTSSDYRLKEDIEPMTGALAKVNVLKPVTYKWKQDGTSSQGFIAHELAEVCPEAVAGGKDELDAEGNPRYQGVDTSFLVATLTAAIQEQQAMITALQADVAALKGNA
jgi:hypothetical protein